jgi:hypothetical protein
MADRPVAAAGSSALRLEILKELQQLTESREHRDRLDKSPLAEAKGREHWVLHLLLRASEVETAHTDTLIGSAYANIISRIDGVEDRIRRIEESNLALEGSLKSRLESLDQVVGERIESGLGQASERMTGVLGKSVTESLDQRWSPIGESLETFAQGSKQLVKGVDDTFRLAAQTRLLLNDNARRLSDLGRDIVALEESLKLVLVRTLEQAFLPLEHRLAAIEAQLGIANNETGAREGEKKPEAPQPSGG